MAGCAADPYVSQAHGDPRFWVPALYQVRARRTRGPGRGPVQAGALLRRDDRGAAAGEKLHRLLADVVAPEDAVPAGRVEAPEAADAVDVALRRLCGQIAGGGKG